MFKIAFFDYIEFVKKNKLLFSLVSIGLIAISFLSLLLIDIIRDGLDSRAYDSSVAYIYKEPVSSKEVFAELKKVGISTANVTFVSDQSQLNEPEHNKQLLADGVLPITDNAVEFENIGVVGHKNSIYNTRPKEIYKGRYFNYSDKGNMTCIVHDSLDLLADNGRITALDYDFDIIGTTLVASQELPYNRSSAVVTVETFAKLDIPLKIVCLYFVLPTTESHANKITEVLDSFGTNEKTEKQMLYFNLGTVFSFISSFALHIAALGVAMSMLILIFKCWISSQQNVFRIYSICGITERKLSSVRKLQVLMFHVPNFLIASLTYATVTLNSNEMYLFTLIPHTFIINFFVILIILFIMTAIQNKKNSGYEVLRES